MKNFASLLLSSIALLGCNALMAQGYSSYPQGGNYSSYPKPSNYSSNASNPSTYTSSNTINWMKSYSEAVALSQSTSKPIAILFTGTGWCPACVKLERMVLNHPDFIQAVSQKFVFLKAEFPDYSESAVMSSPFKPLLDRYGVNAFPTIVVVNANGQVLFTVNYRDTGAQGYAQEFLQKLNQGSTVNSTSYYTPPAQPSQPAQPTPPVQPAQPAQSIPAPTAIPASYPLS